MALSEDNSRPHISEYSLLKRLALLTAAVVMPAMMLLSGCNNDSKIPTPPPFETPTPAATLTADQERAVDEEYRRVATEAARIYEEANKRIDELRGTPTP